MSDFLKAEQVGARKWRVNAIPFGGEFKGGKDLDGEWFSRNTDIKPDWFDRRPVIWHHGGDPEMKDATVGTEDDLELASDGWWATIWLDRAAKYAAQIDALLRSGKAYGSSGAIGHLVRKAASGEILVWPHAEQTLTTMPINRLSRVVPAKAVDLFDEAGITLSPAVRGLLTDLPDDLQPDLPDEGGEDAARLEALAEAAIAAARLRTL
jgi:hypothetical protein